MALPVILGEPEKVGSVGMDRHLFWTSPAEHKRSAGIHLTHVKYLLRRKQPSQGFCVQ